MSASIREAAYADLCAPGSDPVDVLCNLQLDAARRLAPLWIAYMREQLEDFGRTALNDERFVERQMFAFKTMNEIVQKHDIKARLLV